ncbi:MAG: DNA adenine methylase [Clostridiales bacterium]|nr:DNA adenine methylase [Clostridiales bacterium]
MRNRDLTQIINACNSTRFINTGINAKPFMKWAGGKTQLLDELDARLPESIVKEGTIESYVEPFVGGGALFFFLKRKYLVKKAYLSDINKEIMLGYKVIKYNPEGLISELERIQKEYLDRDNERRKEYYYSIRNIYNKQMQGFDYENYANSWIKRASYLIFLNKTCFNGLFRQNKKGEFNVPHGRYKSPNICDWRNINEVHKALRDTKIFCGDFTKAEKFIQMNSLVYFDPPYRPLNTSSGFTSYSKEGFEEEDQKRLADFFRAMDRKGAFLLLSNSDPRNNDRHDDFFDKLYDGFKIERVKANRHINCDAGKRGRVNELIIKNY